MASTFPTQRDKEIFDLIDQEAHRQEFGIELIASENFTSPQVMEAQGSVLTNKYAEGLPGKRYYGGCEVVDVVETLAIERAKELFGAVWANVQPHSGAQANAAVFLSFNPLVVIAAVPTRIPEVTNGDLSSKGTIFLLIVISA